LGYLKINIDMPPKAVKTIKEEIYYQYAKIISESAGYGKQDYRMIMGTWKKLCSGEMCWSNSIHEWIKEMEIPGRCIYCGEEKNLTVEHLLPRCCGGEDAPENVIMVCKSCNSSKGGKRLYEWRGIDAKDKFNHIAEGKYLKYLYSLHQKNGTLDCSAEDMCGRCDMEPRCKAANTVGKLSVFCIEGCFHR